MFRPLSSTSHHTRKYSSDSRSFALIDRCANASRPSSKHIISPNSARRRWFPWHSPLMYRSVLSTLKAKFGCGAKNLPVTLLIFLLNLEPSVSRDMISCRSQRFKQQVARKDEVYECHVDMAGAEGFTRLD